MKQLMVKIPIHSMIDLITNSSTEIFVHSEDSLKPCKELINEILRLTRCGKFCDEIFDVKIDYDRNSMYFDEFEYYAEENDIPFDVAEEEFNAFIEGTGPKPDWIEDYHLQTFLVITPKEEKYEKLAELIKAFLYSPEWYEHSTG